MTTGPKENWLPVAGFEGLYEVSDWGSVRRLERQAKGRYGSTRTLKGREIMPYPQGSGHLAVSFYKDGIRHPRRVHRLVLTTFCRPPLPGEVCRHLDGNPANNRLGNLTWGTYSENAYDRVLHGNHFRSECPTCPRGHELVEPNLVEYEARKGHRKCKACHRGRSMCVKENNLSDERMQANSDWQYRRILEGN